jgi:hypothetical protein
MKSNKSFLALIILIGVSACTKKTPETLISRWETKSDEYAIVERALASAPQGQCLKDVFSVEVLNAEMKELEKKFAGGAKVSGTWKHLDLASLPIPQANFLKTYGDKIGDQKNKDSIDYSTCNDVPCIFNKIYSKENYVAGYVHYIWYLKFGNMLSADNLSPVQTSKEPGEYNGKIHTLDKYLYDEKELYAFWRLSLMLKAPHTNLSYLKEIQRIPRGERFEGEDSGSCGIAYSRGWILLNDGCLSVDQNQPDTGYLYQAVTHELTHHVDFQEGRGTAAFYRSHKPDYLALAGMSLIEFVDANGKQVRQWQLAPGTKLMTSYSGTAPQENFAESISVFRIDGDHAKKQVSEPHFAFVKNNYYAARSFENEEVMKAWIQQYAPETGKAVFKAVVDCSKEPASPKSFYFKQQDFNSPVLPGMLNCMSTQAIEIGLSLKTKITMFEADGCKALVSSSVKSRWDVHIKEHLKNTFDKYLKELEKDKEYLARIQSFYTQVSDKTIAREAYINCYQEQSEEACFFSEIQKGAFEKAEALKLPIEQTRELADMYVAYHPYASIQNETKKFYQSFVASNIETIRTEATSIWDACLSGPRDDVNAPSGRHFQIADGYMISSIYNCLNASVPDAVKDSIRNFSVDGLKIQHSKEELILKDEVFPHLVKMLKDNYVSAREEEFKTALDLLSDDKGEIRKQLLSNFDWIKNVIDTNQIIFDCKLAGLKLIKFDPLFHQKSGLYGNYLEMNSCFNISTTADFNKWLKESKGTFSDKILEDLDQKMTEAAVLRAKECISQYPIDTAVNKIRYRRKRDLCLTNHWQKLAAQVLANAIKDPLVVKFQMSPDVMKSKLEANRRRLQLRIMKEHFNN